MWSNLTSRCYSANVVASDLYQGCAMSGSVLNCTQLPLEAWNGTLADGSNVFSAGRVNGTAFRSLQANVTCAARGVAGNPAVLPVMRLGCDMRLDVMPGSSINASVYLPQLQSMARDLGDVVMRFLTQCRMQTFGASPLTDSQYSMQYR